MASRKVSEYLPADLKEAVYHMIGYGDVLNNFRDAEENYENTEAIRTLRKEVCDWYGIGGD